MLSPAARVTIARLVSGRLPNLPVRRLRLRLPLRLSVFTLTHLDVEDRLDGVADLGLAGVGVDHERVDVLLEQRVGLLAHDRLDDDVAGILHDSPPSLSVGLVEREPAGRLGLVGVGRLVGGSTSSAASVAASLGGAHLGFLLGLDAGGLEARSVFSPAGLTRSDGSTGLAASPSFFGRLGSRSPCRVASGLGGRRLGLGRGGLRLAAAFGAAASARGRPARPWPSAWPRLRRGASARRPAGCRG